MRSRRCCIAPLVFLSEHRFVGVTSLEAVGGRLVGHKAVSADPFAKWRGRGKLPEGRTVDGYLNEIRGADGD
jgi:hypothetical protein